MDATVAFSPRGESLSLILRELKTARKNVDVAMFYLSHQELTDALCFMAQNRKVAVRVLTGAWMDKPAHRPILDRLAQNGVSVFVLPMPGEARMHLKCAIVDGDTVIAGTANWSPTAFEQNFEDTLVIRSPALGQRYLTHLNSLFAKSAPLDAPTAAKSSERISFPEINRYETAKRGASFQAPRARRVVGIERTEVYFSPGRDGLRELLTQVQAATQRIDIGMYLLNDPEIVQALVAKIGKGDIKIRVLLDSGMLSGKLLTQAQALWDAGADIHYFQKDRDALHLKTAILDGRYLWTGTANWTTGAMDLNVEDMLFFDSPELARIYTSFLDDIQKECKSFALVARARESTEAPARVRAKTTDYQRGLPVTGPRTNFNNLVSDPIFPSFPAKAAVSYLSDEEYLPVLLGLIRGAHQSILISMFVMSETKTRAEGQEQVHRALEQAAARGVYVYVLLHTPPSVQDRLHQHHSNWAEKLRAKGIDVRLNLPNIHLHTKMVVVDLAKILIGSHNWSEGALTGKGVYESSALLVLPEQDIRFADYILSRQTISDMRNKDAWEQEIALLRHVAAMGSGERAAFIREREAQAVP
ncbi:MAG TPA: phospholipase D-like domain-containing protein [Kiritimatiellia bacterium]|nr:phospholipase D-like domain-containing protein [Kiritimatiellia bacterium]